MVCSWLKKCKNHLVPDMIVVAQKPEEKPYTYVVGRSSIWSCQISNIWYCFLQVGAIKEIKTNVQNWTHPNKTLGNAKRDNYEMCQMTGNTTLSTKEQSDIKLMPCPFTGPKMFWAGPNLLCQNKKIFTYCGSHKHFVLVKKMICIQ